MADHHPSRRQALRLGAAVTFAGFLAPVLAIATPSGPDAGLLTECAEATRLRAVMNAAVKAIMGLPFAEADARQDELDNATFAYCNAVEQIASVPAVTRAGILAKAVILRESIEEEIGLSGGEVMGDRQHKLGWSLAGDLLGDLAGDPPACLLPSVPAPRPATPDAALIDLCRQFDEDTRALQRYDALAMLNETRDEDELDDLSERWHDALHEITAIPASTTVGIRAKAVALGQALMQCAFIDTEVSADEQGEDYERLAMSLVRDLAGDLA